MGTLRPQGYLYGQEDLVDTEETVKMLWCVRACRRHGTGAALLPDRCENLRVFGRFVFYL
jgi:hypothetical protein